MWTDKDEAERIAGKKKRAADMKLWLDLELGEVLGLPDGRDVTRVPGGWVMESKQWDTNSQTPTASSMVFIPFATSIDGN
jgi:hypothetical protein